MSVIKLRTSDNGILELIENCKSTSGVSGVKLRNSHYLLGKEIAKQIEFRPSKPIAIIAMMRAGLFFAYGIADQIEELGIPVSLLLTYNDQLSCEDEKVIEGKDVLIVDAVINTGKSIFRLLNDLPSQCQAKIATTVIPNSSVSIFDDYELYVIRTSENKYEGAKVRVVANGKGPDTGDRLFGTQG
ncbi:MAG TPA: phosphoribosyltransferase [Flavobacterium sp.]|nr:phosphoribosyltransferase [Flavobacterium sp.]